MEKNRELKAEYKAQENDRELLLKQLVLLKKENAKIEEEIDYYKVIEKNEPDEETKIEEEEEDVQPKIMGKTVDAKNWIDHWNESEQDKVVRYEWIIEKLKSTLEQEWKSLK